MCSSDLVRYFVKHCPVCQKLSAVKFPSHAHPFTTSTYEPMQCLNIDFIGPFPDKGYIFFDTFTRWFKLYHTPDATAKSATQCLLKHFGQFGAPALFFSAEVFRELLDAVGVRHCRTTPYSSEENSLVERANKEINRHIRALYPKSRACLFQILRRGPFSAPPACPTSAMHLRLLHPAPSR